MPSTFPTSKRISATALPPLVATLLLVLSVTTAPAADEKSPRSPLAELHGRVERAFVRCDAVPLRTVLSRKVKTFVATRALTLSDGYYGADQLLLLFERLFEGRTTIRFTALSADPKPRRDGRASLPIRWISSGRGQSRNELSLSFILALEGTDWKIREIRDLK